MPLWQIFHPPSTFTTPSSKQALAADITSIYTSVGLPAFYVVIYFIPIPDENAFVGGQNRPPGSKPFVRFVADHIAVHIESDAARVQGMMKRVDAALRPHVRDKGYDWEVHVDETPRGLWTINGLVPPPFKSEAEKKWSELNRPVEWQEEPEGSS
ncbi:putative oxalocrotonate tautomerase [Corynascus novoguineensis]|uniref:Oxalocrotonate tautomerase n=1 Tax=Corynascus novoguineensis TaxID=1126955 RepID=A0AAN7CKG5_9PEZI|nr:putative oxalocrotonate tautomerase [Corynascus novoguineensis]